MSPGSRLTAPSARSAAIFRLAERFACAGVLLWFELPLRGPCPESLLVCDFTRLHTATITVGRGRSAPTALVDRS